MPKITSQLITTIWIFFSKKRKQSQKTPTINWSLECSGASVKYTTKVKILDFSQAVVEHTFNPCTGRQRQEDLCEFEVSLVGLQSYTETLCLEKQTNTKSQKSPKGHGYF